jgi:hypothetical protein
MKEENASEPVLGGAMIFPQGEGIPLSTNSITAAGGGIRCDPEPKPRRAPPGEVNLITWKDSRNADRTMTLGAYLYQYDFSFHDGRGVVPEVPTMILMVIQALAMSCHMPRMVILPWARSMRQPHHRRQEFSRVGTMPSIALRLSTTVTKRVEAKRFRSLW